MKLNEGQLSGLSNTGVPPMFPDRIDSICCLEVVKLFLHRRIIWYGRLICNVLPYVIMDLKYPWKQQKIHGELRETLHRTNPCSTSLTSPYRWFCDGSDTVHGRTCMLNYHLYKPRRHPELLLIQEHNRSLRAGTGITEMKHALEECDCRKVSHHRMLTRSQAEIKILFLACMVHSGRWYFTPGR